MSKILISWEEILHFFRIDYTESDKLPNESWEDWAERKGGELIEEKIPVFFLPEIDRHPRATVEDLIRWAKARTHVWKTEARQAANLKAKIDYARMKREQAQQEQEG